MSFSREVIKKAKSDIKTIVFPEATDKRILEAVKELEQKMIVKPILIGNPILIKENAQKLKVDISNIEIIYPQESTQLNSFSEELYEIRKTKGLELSQAKELVKEPLYFGAMLVRNNYADGLLSGATHSSKYTIQAALQCIGKKPTEKLASSFFFMEKDNKLHLYADCGFNIDPNQYELANIAIQTANSAKNFGIRPIVAMLSFSTKGSATHPAVTKVTKATEIAKNAAPELIIDGELQFDAAYVPRIRKNKAPESMLQNREANVYVFPDLNSGNIGYKIAERIGGANAYGPILQGLNKPINDLSRGCNKEDIIVMAAITAIQVQHNY